MLGDARLFVGFSSKRRGWWRRRMALSTKEKDAGEEGVLRIILLLGGIDR